MSDAALYGMVGEFDRLEDVVAAARRLKDFGTRDMEAYTPFPSPELDELLVGRQNLLPVLIFLCGMAGLIWGFVMQYWGAVWSYPINVGGRPLDSWPSFVPACFEFGVVWAVAGGFVLFLLFNRLPKFYHPVWAVPDFERASRDRFFLCVEAKDASFSRRRVHQVMANCHATRITEVGA